MDRAGSGGAPASTGGVGFPLVCASRQIRCPCCMIATWTPRLEHETDIPG